MIAVDRRTVLTGALAQVALMLPGISLARAETERRLVVIVLRGAMDGLHMLPPYAEPAYRTARRQLALEPSDEGGVAKLDGHFALHGSLVRTAQLYARGDALFVHAVASPYRGRSHFDAQDVMESGASQPYARGDGWVGRLLDLLPRGQALSLTPVLPLLLRGSADVATYVPSADGAVEEDLLERVGAMYADDHLLHRLWMEALKVQDMAEDKDAGGRRLQHLAGLAGHFLADDRGPRVAVLESHGWDTHTNQVVRLERKLANLDAAVAALETSLGSCWPDSLILALTEFGRTVETNGTGGTDHGTASAVLMAGGAVRGGRIIADWPGVAPRALFDGRDLKPTTDMQSLLTTALAEFYGLDPVRVGRNLFPDARPVLSWQGLVAGRRSL